MKTHPIEHCIRMVCWPTVIPLRNGSRRGGFDLLVVDWVGMVKWKSWLVVVNCVAVVEWSS